MRAFILVVAAACVIVGAVWILQGAGILLGSFMTGQRLWLWIGLAVAAIGIGLGLYGLRPARRAL
jgi:ABC-type anion transport system duplicated permease subunit